MKRLNFRILLILLFLFGSVIHSSGQLSRGGTPLEINASLKSNIPVIDIPSETLEQFLMVPEDDETGRLKHLYFARNFYLQVSPRNSGQWIIHPDGDKIWQIGIRSKGAFSLGLIFSEFRLKGNTRLFVFNENRTGILGAYTSLNNTISGILPVSHLPGECIYIQLEVPRGQAEYGELVIGEVAHAYKPYYSDQLNKDGRYGLSDTCNIDINCEEGTEWQDLKRAVCRILINSSKWCTGTLVNIANSQPETYILTAAHCVGSQTEADKSIFYFNYESPECDGPDGQSNHSISGSLLIATGDTLGDKLNRDSLDFTLLKLSVDVPDSFNVFLAGWNRDPEPALQTVTIHHPHGDVKKISFDSDPPVTGYHTVDYYPEYVLYSHWRIVRWDLGTTEMGSSGAPLFDQDQRIVGLLTGGFATCDSSVNDYFTKLDYSWDYYDSPLKQLKIWLDPSNTGVITMDGRDFSNHTDVYKQDQIKIYPNPGSGKYIIHLDGPASNDIIINVFSLSGKIVFSDRILHTGLYYLNLDDLVPGLYIVRLILPDRIFTHKIIHQPE